MWTGWVSSPLVLQCFDSFFFFFFHFVKPLPRVPWKVSVLLLLFSAISNSIDVNLRTSVHVKNKQSCNGSSACLCRRKWDLTCYIQVFLWSCWSWSLKLRDCRISAWLVKVDSEKNRWLSDSDLVKKSSDIIFFFFSKLIYCFISPFIVFFKRVNSFVYDFPQRRAKNWRNQRAVIL